MRATIELDLSEWPLATVTMPGEKVTMDELQRFVQGQRDMLARAEPHVLVCDARRTPVMPPDQRKVWAEWLEEADEPTRRYTKALAIVISNSLVRGALTAVLWLRKPPCETRTFGTVAEAREWCLDRAHAEGMRRPA